MNSIRHVYRSNRYNFSLSGFYSFFKPHNPKNLLFAVRCFSKTHFSCWEWRHEIDFLKGTLRQWRLTVCVALSNKALSLACLHKSRDPNWPSSLLAGTHLRITTLSSPAVPTWFLMSLFLFFCGTFKTFLQQDSLTRITEQLMTKLSVVSFQI